MNEKLLILTPVKHIPRVFERLSTLSYDIIYQPLETKLLKIAKKNNHNVINGLRMNLLQACIAISKATGKKNYYTIEKIISGKN